MRKLAPMLFVSTALSMMLPAAAFAQDKGSDPSATDIIVTARRVEERLQDVPISITVFNQQQLSNRNVVNANDLATYTPSLSSDTNFGSQNTAFAIRGFVQDVGTAPSVGTYFADVVAPRGAANNVPIGDGAGPGSFFDLQNVQVLKGPQGTLFGRNTTGGAVLLVPQRPTDKFEGYVEGSYGNYNLRRIQGVINVPIGNDGALRIGVDHEQRDGYLRNTSGIGPGRFDDIDYTAVRASLLVHLTPDLENYTIASYSRSSTNGDLQKLVVGDPTSFIGGLASAQLARNAGAGFFTVQNGQSFQDARTKLTQWQIINTTTWRVSDNVTLKNIISYAQLREFLNTALFGADFVSPATLTLPIGPGGSLVTFPNPTAGQRFTFSGIKPVTNGNEADQSTFTEEFRIQGDLADQKLNYQIGAYLESSVPIAPANNIGTISPIFVGCTSVNTVTNQYNCTNPLSFGGLNYNTGTFQFHDVGLYGQATYKLTTKLSLTGGIRYTWDRTKTDSILGKYNIPFSPNTILCTQTLQPGICELRYNQRSKAPTWLVDVDYKPTNNLLIYAKYSRGYRTGGITPNAPAAVAIFQPEKVDSYEGGLKSSFGGALHGTFNVSGFYNDFSNQQIQLGVNPKPQFVGSVAGATPIFNVGKSRIYGAEVESSITPFTGFTADISYTYLNTRIQKVKPIVFPEPTPFLPPISSAEPGDPIVLSPRHKLAATGTYTLPLDQSIGIISVGATVVYTSRQLANYVDRTIVGRPDVQALSYIAPRTLINLNLLWRSVGGLPLDLSAFATNVTNRKYYSSIPGLFNFTNFNTAAVGEPRMFGGRVKVRF